MRCCATTATVSRSSSSSPGRTSSASRRRRPLRHVRHGPGQRARRVPPARRGPRVRQGRRLHVELPAVAGPRDARRRASRGYLSKSLPAAQLVDALAAPSPPGGSSSRPSPRAAPPRRWRLARSRGGPHRARGRGAVPDHDGPEQPGDRRAHLLSLNSIKSYIRSATARSTSTAAPRPSCGASRTGCAPTGCGIVRLAWPRTPTASAPPDRPGLPPRSTNRPRCRARLRSSGD